MQFLCVALFLPVIRGWPIDCRNGEQHVCAPQCLRLCLCLCVCVCMMLPNTKTIRLLMNVKFVRNINWHKTLYWMLWTSFYMILFNKLSSIKFIDFVLFSPMSSGALTVFFFQFDTSWAQEVIIYIYCNAIFDNSIQFNRFAFKSRSERERESACFLWIFNGKAVNLLWLRLFSAK